MKNLFKKVLTVVLTIALTTLNVNTFSGTTVWAATVFQADVVSPSNGNIFVYVDGTFLSESSAKLLNRINEIRKEACEEGIINPDTGNKLTLSDYKPIIWCTALEDYARLRAAEASVNWSHIRPNNKSTFKNKVRLANGYHSSENLAMGYELVASIEGYYSEKANWVKKSGIYGHYTNMISPDNTLVGMAGFTQKGKSTFSAMEFGTLFSNTNPNNSSVIGLNCAAMQLVEVNVSYLVNSISISGEHNIGVNNTTKLTASVSMKNATKSAIVSDGLIWTSSDTSIVKVDNNGNIKGVSKGSATITAICGNKTATYTITVNSTNITSNTIVTDVATTHQITNLLQMIQKITTRFFVKG